MPEKANVEALIAEHKKQLGALLQEHQKQIETAQTNFEALVIKSNQELQKLISGDESKPLTEAPQAVWHKDHLVLNRPAAALIDELLSRTGEVLAQIGKLIPKGKA